MNAQSNFLSVEFSNNNNDQKKKKKTPELVFYVSLGLLFHFAINFLL